MKRLVAVAMAALLSGCASSGSGLSSDGTVRTTTSVTPPSGRTVRLESYEDGGGLAQRVAAAPDRVWQTLPAVYQALGIDVNTSIPASRTIGANQVRLSRTLAGQRLSSFLMCGDGPTGGPLADSYQVTMTVMTYLTPAENGGTRVETRVDASAVDRATSSTPVTCGTTGNLERLIHERIASQVS